MDESCPGEIIYSFYTPNSCVFLFYVCDRSVQEISPAAIMCMHVLQGSQLSRSCCSAASSDTGAFEHAILISLMFDRSIEVPVHHCTRKPKTVAKTTLQGAISVGSSSESEGDEAGAAPPFLSGRPSMQGNQFVSNEG